MNRLFAASMFTCALVGGVLSQPAAAAQSIASTCPVIVANMIDCSKSTSPEQFGQMKQETRQLLNNLPSGVCATVLAITEDSLGRLGQLLPSEMVVDAKYRDWPRPIIAKWDRVSESLQADRLGTDVLGALWNVGRIPGRAGAGLMIIVVMSDLRHNAHRVNLDSVAMIDQRKAMRQITDQELLPDLKNTQVWFLGVSLEGKDAHFFRTQQGFWSELVRANGGTVAEFSPLLVGWTPAIVKTVKEVLSGTRTAHTPKAN